MNTFNKKSLYVAMAGLSALGVTGAAQAVTLNADGLGQVLIYPYYTVREQAAGATFNSLLSVVNSTASAKAVKVRFLEGKFSREVLDFNLYLSPKDVWTAAIVPTATSAGVFTADKSCTQPTVSSSGTAPTEFVNFGYTGTNADGADTSLDRTREGYVEIIEMGNVIGTVATGVTHVSGVPPACPSASAVLVSGTDIVPGNGGLFGGMTLVNVPAGEDFTEDAVALDFFSQTTLWTTAGDTNPTLANVNPKISVVTTGNTTYASLWPVGQADPVSAVLMHNNVYNEFVLDAVTKSGTDWVVTMPTKRNYYSGTQVINLFQRNFTATGACDDVLLTQYDREERTVASQTSFSPPPPTNTDSLCWEANVITFNNSNVLGSKNQANVTSGFANGWVTLNFPLIATATPPRHVLVAGTTNTVTISPATGAVTAGQVAFTTYNGLPVVGFMVQTFVNGALGTPPILSNYGGNFIHKYTRSIQ